MPNLVLLAPLEGWSAPLEEVPDAVFAGSLLGDGVAIDPTGSTLCAPCDGEVITIPAQKHAITLRAANGAQILLHIGIDTVALGGEGFIAHVAVGAHVKAGDTLLTFDLDYVAQRAKSLLTPIIVTDEMPFAVVRRAIGRAVSTGDFLMELAPVGATARAVESSAASAGDVARATPAASTAHRGSQIAHMNVPLEHGLHARPAALLVATLKRLAATVSIAAHGKSVNARSAIGIMSLGVRKGDEITLSADGPDAAVAIAAIQDAIRLTTAEGPKGGATFKAGGMAGEKADATIDAARRQQKRLDRVSGAVASTKLSAGSGVGVGNAVITGVTASPGLAVGRAFQLVRKEIRVEEAGKGAAVEQRRLDAAVSAVRKKVQAAAASERGAGHEVLMAHLEFLDDPELIDAAREWIVRDKSAGFAWRQAVRINVDVLRALPDARMGERADDLLDLESQVLTELAGAPSEATDGLSEHAILLADELLPSQFIALDASRLAGICTAGGGPTSHVAILAAALNVPMLVAAGPALRDIPNGTTLILDADNGTLQVSPEDRVRSGAEAKVTRRRERQAAERAAAQRDCRTADGTRIEVFANVGSVDEARAAVVQGAEGCGLLRTEFLFLDRDTAPDESVQTALYAGIVSAFDGRPVVVRTLDSGGDKPLAYMPLPVEENPALGVRGVRVSLLYPQVLRSQLRAILSAQPRGRCRILLPMISDAAEVRAVGEMLDDVRGELGHDDPVSLGAMIETPAAAMVADQIAREADFLSIGTNDLTQYALAIDRGNPVLAPRLDSLHPAVLRLISRTTEGAQINRRAVAVCGGLASDPTAAPILIGLGVNELSAVPSVVPRLKALISTLTLAACQTLARRALEQQSAAQVRALVSQAGWLTQ